jgi:esterase
MPSSLFYERLGEGPDIVFLHGLYGAGRNWRTVAQALAPAWRSLLPDARNHGRSFHSPEMDYMAMAADLEQLLTEQEIAQAIVIGHSMGGKTALTFAQHYPARVRGLMLVDIAPRAYPAQFHHQVLTRLLALDLATLTGRTEADHALCEAIPDPAVRAFLLANLTRVSGRWHWRLNLPVLLASLDTLTGALPPPPQPLAAEFPVQIVAGGHSDYVQAEDATLFAAWLSAPEIVTIEGAGHWVHTDQPAAFQACLQAFLQRC